MFSLATLVLAAIPYCQGTTDEQACAKWMANDMMLEQAIHKGISLDTLCEISSERIPGYFWDDQHG